jgi:hypothetical protein
MSTCRIQKLGCLKTGNNPSALSPRSAGNWRTFPDPSQQRKELFDPIVALKGLRLVKVFKDNAVGHPFYERFGFVFVFVFVFVFENNCLHEQSGQVTF